MSQPTCRHVHANGALCKSPPLRNRDYCHFHLDQIGRQLRAARARARHQPARLKLPLLEDPFAVQVALMQVADAIIYNEIDVQRGRLLMGILRVAAGNLKTARAWKQEALFVATENANTEWPSFEQENQLPPDFDLSVDPEVAFPLPQVRSLPVDANLGHAPSDSDLHARLRQALDDAQTSGPLVTADHLQLVDICESEGMAAGRKFAAQMARNDRRRRRRVQRAHYEELARNHNIKIAARKLMQEQQAEAAVAASANAHETASEARNVADESPQKKPVSGVAAQPRIDAARSSGAV